MINHNQIVRVGNEHDYQMQHVFIFFLLKQQEAYAIFEDNGLIYSVVGMKPVPIYNENTG